MFGCVFVLHIPNEAEIQHNSAYFVIQFVPMVLCSRFLLCFALFAHIGLFYPCLRLAARQHVNNHT